jgi:hypothetical protein
MTELECREALEDCELVNALWTRWLWGQQQQDDEEEAFEAALAAFDEQRPQATLFRRNAFKRALMFVSSLDKVHKAAISSPVQSAAQSDLATELRQREARCDRLDRALKSTLSSGYFDSSRLLVAATEVLVSRYGYVCSCRCAFCVRSHGSAPRVFLWRALFERHVAESRSYVKPAAEALHAPSVAPPPSTLDGAEELADIIAGAMTEQ